MPASLAPSRPSPRSGCVFGLGWWVGRLIVWFLALSVGFTLLYRVVPPLVTPTMLLDANGFTRDWTSLSRIDRNMVAAVIAAEDGKFCSHNGFDTKAMAAAAVRNARGGMLRGGSTISQQTAKNVFLWRGEGWTRYLRKGLEAWFTFLIEHLWDKRRIMEVYLNIAETGIGTYGAEAGARRYFHHGASRLSPGEAAAIAAALPSPKTRGVVAPRGFTRRYAATIAARARVVRREGLDGCVYR
jgi:monofunctional glycosyltransferase